MKFLCAKCDEPMKLEQATGPEDGSVSITFACPKCENRTSLLTNPMETQLLRTLHVQIGGRTAPAEPMELVRSSLAWQRDPVFTGQPDGSNRKQRPNWTEEAEKRLENVPSFVRNMARHAIERYAMEEGHETITPELMNLARHQLGM